MNYVIPKQNHHQYSELESIQTLTKPKNKDVIRQ